MANKQTPESHFVFNPDIKQKGETGVFYDANEKFAAWSKTHYPLPPLQLKDGWHEIGPVLAEQLLMRNVHGANRRPSLPQIRYYIKQMKAGLWPRTGQPLIFDADGNLIDGQHRLIASILGKTTFSTYVVTNVPKHPNLFAYIDNGKVRSLADALQTAGCTYAPAVVNIIDWGVAYDNNLFAGDKKRGAPRMTPVEILGAATQYPHAEDAATLTVQSFAEAAKLIDKRVVGFMTMKILDIYGDETLAESFWEQVTGEVDSPPDGAAAALGELMKKEALKNFDAMSAIPRLANTIIAFNLWMRGELPSKKWKYAYSDSFPVIDPKN